MWGQRGTWGSKKFVTAKQGVYPRGDTFRGILELQLGAVVLELMVFGEQKKGNGSAGAVFEKKLSHTHTHTHRHKLKIESS